MIGKNKKTIWIMNHYAGEMLIDKGGRHYGFAKYLKRNGYEPIVFCANTKHGKKERWIESDDLWIERNAEEIDTPFVFVRSSIYVGNGKDRVLNMVNFYRNIKKTAKTYASKNGKPDVIYASSVHPLTLVAGIQLAKKYGVKCICEVRDLWPESIVVYDLAKEKSLVVTALRWMEKWIYRKADDLVFTMEGGTDYIEERKWNLEQGGPIDMRKVHYINNGVDLERFDYDREHHRIQDSDLNDTNIFKVIYSGSIRKVNNLGLLLDTAKKITDRSIRFLVWGDGDELEYLKLRVRDEGIENVVFKGRVDKQYIPYITSCADLNIAHNIASSLQKYGISLNKLFDYLAAGKPILCDFPSAYNPSIQAKAGFEVSDSSPDSIANEIGRIRRMSATELNAVGKNARDAAEQLYDYSKLTQKLINVIEEQE